MWLDVGKEQGGRNDMFMNGLVEILMELLEYGRYGRYDGGGGTVTKCILARVLIFSNIEVAGLHSSNSQTYAGSTMAAACKISLLDRKSVV